MSPTVEHLANEALNLEEESRAELASILLRSLDGPLLASRHSKLGQTLLSRDVDGSMPPRDPRKRIGKRLVRKAAKRASVSDDALYSEIESLSTFLGWNVLNGLDRKES